MRLESAGRRPGLLAEALARAGGWLLEPATLERPFEQVRARPVAAPEVARARDAERAPVRPVVAVVALAPRCGGSTLARALAARLAGRDPSGAAIVVGTGAAPGFSPAGRAAARLAARIASDAELAGRLCLARTDDYAALMLSARELAPLVFDVPRDRSPAGAVSLADLTIIVAPGDGEPALAELAARSLARPGREPVVVVSRPADPARWSSRAALVLPESRAGARLAAAGWEPRGPLGAEVARLGEMCEAAA